MDKANKKLLYISSDRHTRPSGCPCCKLRRFHEKIKNNRLKRFSKYGDFKSYSRKARNLTKILNNKYGWFNNNRNKHIDHIVSIRDCFLNAIPLFVCSSFPNLRLISAKTNKKKFTKSKMSVDLLIKKFKLYMKNNKDIL
jgi:hypothetical protein